MTTARCTEEEFVNLWAELRSPSKVAAQLGLDVRKVYKRRANIEKSWGIRLEVGNVHGGRIHYELNQHHAMKQIDVPDGVVIIASDCHYWPDQVTTGHRALVGFIRALQPKAVILNGDVLDGARISRFPPSGWTDENKPSVIQELETCQQRLAEIEAACAPDTVKMWTLGNHDGRFESKLAMVAPQFAKVRGVHLRDHFPAWTPSWAANINRDVVVKHRFKGGVHATHNNTLSAGMSMVTGHLHSLKVTPYTDYRGTRFGVDTGTLSDCYGPQTADYTEMNPVNWRSGFAVLTFHEGRLLWPELVHVIGDGKVEFRGGVHEV